MFNTRKLFNPKQLFNETDSQGFLIEIDDEVRKKLQIVLLDMLEDIY